jgi:hypothetical protein
MQIPDAATLIVKVTQGSVDIYDSSVDNLSGDSVVTPIGLQPVSLASSATIGPSGGSISSPDGRFTLRVPAGALAQPAGLSFQPGTNDATLGIGAAYQLHPSNVTFSKPALLILAYGSDDTASNGPDALSLVANDGSDWFVLGGGSVDTSRRTLTVLLSSTSPAKPSSVRAAPQAVAGPPGDWTFGAATSWVMSPRGRLAILIGGHRNFTVKSTGPSSSTHPSNFLLSRSASDVEVTWLVNNEIGGNIIDGTIGAVPINTTYDAPNCPPPRNPVTITAQIQNTSALSLLYHVRSYARVRVLYKNWTFTTIWDQVFTCPGGFAQDHVRYEHGFSFSLDDNINITNVVYATRETTFVGSVTPCDPKHVADVQRIDGPRHTVTFQSGEFDPVRNSFDFTLDWVFPTDIGYTYTAVGDDGTKFPGQQFGPGLPTEAPGTPFVADDMNAPYSTSISQGYVNIMWTLSLQHTPTAQCH